MAYQDNLKELREASRQMEHHAEDFHPELAGKPTPGGIQQPEIWGDSADVFIEQQNQNNRQR